MTAHRTTNRPLPLDLVIAFIGLVLLMAVALIGILAVRGQPAPDVLQNIAVGSLTGLVGLLVPTRSTTP